MEYSSESIDMVLNELNSSEKGLTDVEANKRLNEFGYNELAQKKKDSLFKRVIVSLSDPMIIVLIFAAIIQTIVNLIETNFNLSYKDFVDVLIIFAVIVINTIISIVQDYKSENALESLKEMTSAKATCLRNGLISIVSQKELVPGDIILLKPGVQIPADCRLIEAKSLRIEESALTGESAPIKKSSEILNCEKQKESILDMKNMIFNGTTVMKGTGKAIVVNTGMNTEIGKIAEVLTKAKDKATPLQIKMLELSKILTKSIIIICLAYFVINILWYFANNGWTLSFDESFLNVSMALFISAVSLAIAAIPEGLPAVVTIIMSLGISSMSKKNALVRKLTAVETLGCTQIICSDKTGTLTQNKMTVTDFYSDDEGFLAKAFALCCDAKMQNGVAEGEPTEAALVEWASKKNNSFDEKRVGEIPFDSERKIMSTLYKDGNGFVQYTKGAPDVILGKCSKIWNNGKINVLSDKDKDEILSQNKEFADKALRVLACSFRHYDNEPDHLNSKDNEDDLVFIGLAGMIDPVRPEAKKAITQNENAGITPIMITGDNIDTAKAIAIELGILDGDEIAITGSDLDKMDDNEFEQKYKKISVYARVRPEHKTRIVTMWQNHGYVVAMTGDGVNDAPSIKKADIGICMGLNGADVTKNASDMVLTDDNYKTIVDAVEEGRKIYSNIRKVLQSQLSMNVSELCTVLLASFIGVLVLSPVQLLWINMVVDSLPVLALGIEKCNDNVMNKKPRNPKDSIFNDGLGLCIIAQGIILSAMQIGAYFIGLYIGSNDSSPEMRAMTYVFLTVCFTGITCTLNMRSRTESVFSKNLINNKNWWLIGASIIMLFVSIMVIFIPGLSNAFIPNLSSSFNFILKSDVICLSDVVFCLLLSLLVFPLFEAIKLFLRKKGSNN